MRTTDYQKTKKVRDVISGLKRDLALKKLRYSGPVAGYFEKLDAEAQIEMQRFNYEIGRLTTLEKLLREIPEEK